MDLELKKECEKRLKEVINEITEGEKLINDANSKMKRLTIERNFISKVLKRLEDGNS